mmetsp:Transcript_38613/g.75967  ORF Transcript_38613/g.75967 Transcript_38613/m.75967 type:complete len:376 (+) Transcript_38613:67-1194(+)
MYPKKAPESEVKKEASTSVCLSKRQERISELKQHDLRNLSRLVLTKLRESQPEIVEGLDPDLHYLPPRVNKETWNALGDLVNNIEKHPPATGKIPGEEWISLRLDGTGFSKAVRLLRKKGILEPKGFSARFAECMQNCCEALMTHLNAKIGYTQSDEMVVFIAPASIVRGEQQGHQRSGRICKLTTLAASFVTARFVLQLAQLCAQFGVDINELLAVSPHFDCRLGHYKSWEEAQSLLMWRAYDCSVNGVSDAVYHSEGGKKITSKNTKQKLLWLDQHGHLPLPPHQAYGTLMAKVKRLKEGFNPHAPTKSNSEPGSMGCTVQVLRSTIERIKGSHVLELVRTDSVWLTDDAMPDPTVGEPQVLIKSSSPSPSIR